MSTPWKETSSSPWEYNFLSSYIMEEVHLWSFPTSVSNVSARAKSLPDGVRYERKVKVNLAHSYLTVCDPMDYTIHVNLQARILEWVAFPSSRDLPTPGIKPRPPTSQLDSLPTELPGKPMRGRTAKGRVIRKRMMLPRLPCRGRESEGTGMHLCPHSISGVLTSLPPT